MRELTSAGLEFLRERHLATLSTFAPWGGIHTVPVGFTWKDGILRIITSGDSQKVRNIRRDGTATISQLAGGDWITFQGTATVHSDADAVAEAVALYAVRYREPRVNPLRVAIRITPQRLMGSARMVDQA